jgi:hypothetical protein
MANRISIEIVGAASDREDVRLNDLIDQLRTVKKALRETERAVTGRDELTLDYKVVDLRHHSPSTIVLEPVSFNGQPPSPGLMPRVVNTFTTELGLIKREKKLLIEPDLPRLAAYRDIGKQEHGQSRIEKVVVRSGGHTVTIDTAFKRNLEDIVGPDEFSEGTISGSLEALNFHNTNKFTLYPPLGPKKVIGTFPMELRPTIKDAIGSFVTVTGKLCFKAWSPYPHGVLAETIDIHEPDSDLPTLTKLRGAFAGSTGELNSAEFVDRLRNEDW